MELRIQPGAYAAAYSVVGVEPFDREALRFKAAVEAAAPLIVALELDRWAELIGGGPGQMLTARAKELRGGAE